MTQIDDDIRDLKSRSASEWASWLWQHVIGGGGALLASTWRPAAYMLFAAVAGGVAGGTLVAEPTAPLRGWLEQHHFVTPIPQAAPVTFNDGSQQVLGQLQRMSADISTKFGQLAGEIKTSRDLAAGYDIHLGAIAEGIKSDIKAIPGHTAALIPKPTKTIVYESKPAPKPASKPADQ